MPELPEVETIIRDLKEVILDRKIEDVWIDPALFRKGGMVKQPKSFEQFKKEIKGKKILKIWRRGKNILFDLSENKTLLIHQKLTGHLLLGRWQIIKARSQNSKVKSLIKGPLEEKINEFIRLIFYLDDGRQLALSDLRKFAKVELLDKENLEKELRCLGPEPLEKNFSFEKFKKCLKNKKGKIKQVLMDQSVIAGIGNIYSDEILWQAKIHPFKNVPNLKEEELKRIYQATKKILPTAIKLGGESISDFRRISGERGYFDKERKVYRREGEKCSRCGIIIKRLKIGGRSVHFCPRCQLR
jgi:formamidopyrimidine-DNA glycosylase